VVDRRQTRRTHGATRVVALAACALGICACAAILGIDERFPEEPDASPPTEAGTDAGAADTSPLDATPPLRCEVDPCVDAGGRCELGRCTFVCDEAGTCEAGATLRCPSDNDCEVRCTADDSCKSLGCAGGRSCAIGCTAARSCREGIRCASERCDIACQGVEACKSGAMGGPILCEAGTCHVACTSADACNEGVLAHASSACAITCSGAGSCHKPPVACVGTDDASIECAAGACVNGVPTCDGGGHCTIQCATPSCGAGYCCTAATCAIDAGDSGPGNKCQ